jgi:hypothetical protein
LKLTRVSQGRGAPAPSLPGLCCAGLALGPGQRKATVLRQTGWFSGQGSAPGVALRGLGFLDIYE